MKKILIAVALVAGLAPVVASAQYYDNSNDYRIEYRNGQQVRVYYDRYGNAYYDNRPVDNRYYGDRYDRYDRNRNRYDDRVVCRDVVVRDRNEGAAVAGAVIGGILGNQIGSGSGRTAATVGGAVVGGLVGNEVSRDRHGNRIEQRCERVRY
jgi:hypothetical protein